MLESSQSFASSVRDYLYENGRRYHAYRQGKYPLPNDEREQDRLDLVHYLWKELVNGDLYRAPISPSNTHRILDFGTGTGNWAFEMAEAFPHAEIVGTDLSPIQPVWCPPNCRFFIDDVESEWTYLPHEAFDYIHGRVMAGSISDWDRLLSQIYDHLKPGGWVELQEYECSVWSDDGTHQRVEAFHEWARKVNDASIQFGKPVNVADVLPQKIRDAGFVDVTDDVYKVSLSNGTRDIPSYVDLILTFVQCYPVSHRLLAQRSPTQTNRSDSLVQRPRGHRALHSRLLHPRSRIHV